MISRKKKLTLSVLNILAISGTKGSSGLGSQSKEQIDNNTVKKVKKKMRSILGSGVTEF